LHVIEDFAATIGEGPLWSARHQALFWIDTVNKKIMRTRAPFTAAESRDLPYKPSCLALLHDDRLLVGYKKGIGLFDFDSGEAEQLPLRGVSFEHQIFNDGACDGAGRLWIGTRDRNVRDPVGALYSIGPDLVAREHVDGVVLSNGIAWSPDGRTMYHTESGGAGRIDAYDFDATRGTLSNRRIFIDYAGRGPGHGDGCTVDAEGYLWVAEVQGSRVARYAPDGRLDREIPMPVSRPTSVMFGGLDYTTLFVTSMRYGLSADDIEAMPYAGMLFVLDAGLRGVPENPFRLAGT